MMKTLQFDVVIVGGGPAGLTAALYCRRAGLSVMVIEKMVPGGQMNIIKTLDNYPGLPGISGSDLADQLYAQVQTLGAEFLFDEIDALDLATKTVTTPEAIFHAKVIILATGAGPRKTGAANETKYLNNGVHYCATCDGPLYRGQAVVLVGGNQAALEDALFLASICQSVTIINPAPTFNAESNLIKAVETQPNVTVHHHCQIKAIVGTNQISQVVMADVTGGQTQSVPCQGVFVAMGRVPNLDLCRGQIKVGPDEYVLTDENCQTNLPGVYAIGDIRAKSCRQVVTAMADGATAATTIVTAIQMQGVK